MEPFTLLVTETREGAERVLSAVPEAAEDGVAVVALNEPAWYARLRAYPRQRHVGVVVESLARVGLLTTAVTAVAGAARVSLVASRSMLAAERLDQLAAVLAEAGAAPAETATLTVDGEPAAVLAYRHDRPDPGAAIAVLAALADLASAPRPAPAMGARLATVGTVEATWFGGWAPTLALGAGDVGRLAQATGGHLDALLVAADAGPAAAELAEEARSLGAKAVGIDRAQHAPVKVDVEVRSRPGAPVVMARPVDPLRVNPCGYRSPRPDRFAAVLGRPSGWEAALPALLEAAGERPLDLLAPEGSSVPASGDGARVVDAPSDPAAVPGLLRDYAVVLDHPGLHADSGAQAAHVARLAAAGVPPVLLGDRGPLSSLLGDDLSRALAELDAGALGDPLGHERASVKVRRAALRTVTLPARWRELAAVLDVPVRSPRRVSLLLPVNRPDFLERAVAQVNAQRYDHCELVVALHGEAFPAGTQDWLADAVSVPLTVVGVPAARCLGDVLNAATDAAGGDVLVKMDDDDWYAVDHVDDLVSALDYSAATLVGKGAEFCYLSDLDLTIRRSFDGPAERPDRKLAGGTLAIPRADLDAMGGWRRVGRAVDQRLIDAVLAAGGTVHRTHGFGYVLNRHGRAHTWAAESDYFLKQTSLQRDGLDLGVAGVPTL